MLPPIQQKLLSGRAPAGIKHGKKRSEQGGERHKRSGMTDQHKSLQTMIANNPDET